MTKLIIAVILILVAVFIWLRARNKNSERNNRYFDTKYSDSWGKKRRH